MRLFLILVFGKIFNFCKLIGNSDEELYAFKSVGIFTVFLSFNVITMLGYFNCFVKRADTIIPSVFSMLLIILGIGVGLYRYFIKGSRYVEMYGLMVANTSLSGWRGTLITLFYMIATIAFIVSLIWLPCSS